MSTDRGWDSRWRCWGVTLADNVSIAALLRGPSSDRRRRRSHYACAVTMQCSPGEARSICDGAAREERYFPVDESSCHVRYTLDRAQRRDSSLWELEANFKHETGATTVTIVGYRRSKFQRLLRRGFSARAEIVVFRDQLWCHAAQAQIAAKVL
jgi:hypothetical protein